jgi:hypothetical protein
LGKGVVRSAVHLIGFSRCRRVVDKPVSIPY